MWHRLITNPFYVVGLIASALFGYAAYKLTGSLLSTFILIGISFVIDLASTYGKFYEITRNKYK